MTLDVSRLDFNRCEDERIHAPESIQSYGYLFAFDTKTFDVEIISENTQNILTMGKNVIGKNFISLLEDDGNDIDFLESTFKRVAERNTRLPARITFKRDCILEGRPTEYLAVVYASEEYFVIELEPAAEFREIFNAQQYIKLYAMSIAPRFKSLTSLEMMAKEIVDTIKYLTNMERVVLYKFNEDHSGKVIAESKIDEIDSYMGLYYPASDIPPQARELYKINWVRLTPDVDLETSPLLPSVAEGKRKALDLTQSLLRTFSPIHLQYIRNQGLRASFSISLVTHGELWGLISCHSRKPQYLPQDVRLQCENLSQLFSWHLFAKEEELLLNKKQATDEAVNKMLDNISPTRPIVKVVQDAEADFLNAMDCDGFMYYSQQETITIGQTLDVRLMKEIFSRASADGKLPYITDSLVKEYPDEALNSVVGLMVIPLVEKRQFFTAWFRRERKLTQKWAGVEQEKSESASKKERLTPRASFKVNVREIIGHSKPFDKYDVDMANRLNRMFLVHSLDMQGRMHSNLMELQKQDKYRNEFLATLAHELRNPLAPISSGVSILEMSDDEDVKKRVVGIIKRQSAYMSKLIDDLMDVSRITRGKIKLEEEVLELQEVLSHAAEMVAAVISEKNHELNIQRAHVPLLIKGDKARISQIFSNVLQNAAKYTDPNGKIDIKIESDGQWVITKIKDNGIGIPPDRLDDVFQMFTQVDARATYTKGGLGIGLTLVEKLVSLQGGEVSVVSEGLGKGSEFVIKFPLSEPLGSADEVDGAEGLHEEKSAKILFVDDNKDVLDTYHLLFESLGYRVESTSSSIAAIDLFKRFKPDFAFLDIGMPEMDGYELCQKLSALEEARDTIFFSQSGWGSQKDIDRALAAGFDEHFIKPLTLEGIESALNRHIRA